MRSKERAKSLGEVFTPQFLVERMLDKIPSEVLLNPEKTVLDNSCGNGQFLVEVMERRITAGIPHLAAIRTIYGIDISELNTDETKQRLAKGSKDAEIWAVLHHNIICADALDPNHPGWKVVGYMWDDTQKSRSNKFFDVS